MIVCDGSVDGSVKFSDSVCFSCTKSLNFSFKIYCGDIYNTARLRSLTRKGIRNHWLSIVSQCLSQSSKAVSDRKSFHKSAGFDGESGEPSERANVSVDVELGHSQTECLAAAGGDPEDSSRSTAITQFEGKALGIDKAILHSIDSCCKCLLTLADTRLKLGKLSKTNRIAPHHTKRQQTVEHLQTLTVLCL